MSSGNEEINMNDSILDMISNLKPQLKAKLIDSPLKQTSSSLGPPSLSSSTTIKRERPSCDGGILGEYNNFATPAKKFKVDDKLQTPSTLLTPSSIIDYGVSPRETRRLRADLLEARNNIRTLENQIQRLQSFRMEMHLTFESELAVLRKQRQQDVKTVSELEMQLQAIRKRENDIKNEHVDIKNKYDQLRINSDLEIQKLKEELNTLHEEYNSVKGEGDDLVSNLKVKLDDCEQTKNSTEEELEALRQLISDMEERLTKKEEVERNYELKDAALQKARLELKELDYLRENYNEYQQQIKTHQHKLASYTELEKENQQLKGENKRLYEVVQNKLILEEEVHDLTTKLVRYKEQEKSFAVLQANEVQLDRQLNEWKAVARGICESTGSDSTLPHLLRSVVEHLQQQEVTLNFEKMELQSQLSTALHDAQLARSELGKNQKLLTEMQNTVQQRQNLLHRLQKKVFLVSRERDSYRQHLDSYEKDLTICVTAGTHSATSSTIQTQKDRIQNLENTVEGYREMVEKLENDLKQFEPNVESDVAPVRIEQTNRLKQEVDKLKLENDHLREQKDKLEIRLEEILVGVDKHNGGEDNRIVHCVKNPLSEYLQDNENLVENMKEEIHRLKLKIRKMEEGLEASKLNESACLSAKEIENLKEQLKSAESQITRLKDYFKSSMQEFRNIIYMLFGYKVDKTALSQYKLTSMYADRREDQILFQLQSDGAMNLLATEFSSTLEELIELHLRHQKSIPVFLSAITMNLFNDHTLPTKSYEIKDDD